MLNLTQKEIETIKAQQWDKGWRYGLLTGISISLICIIIACFLL